MEEVGAFLGAGGQRLYEGAVSQFQRLATDRRDEAAILAFLRGVASTKTPGEA